MSKQVGRTSDGDWDEGGRKRIKGAPTDKLTHFWPDMADVFGTDNSFKDRCVGPLGQGGGIDFEVAGEARVPLGHKHHLHSPLRWAYRRDIWDIFG